MPFGQETDHAYSTARRAYMGLNTTKDTTNITLHIRTTATNSNHTKTKSSK